MLIRVIDAISSAASTENTSSSLRRLISARMCIRLIELNRGRAGRLWDMLITVKDSAFESLRKSVHMIQDSFEGDTFEEVWYSTHGTLASASRSRVKTL